jgi:DNA-binding SARP family transcriptional activator
VEEALTEARALWKQVGNERWCAFTTLVLVFWKSFRGDETSAERLAGELLELAERQPDPWDAALAKVHAVVPVMIRQGQLDEASLLLDEAMEVYRARKYVIGIAHALDAQAFLAFRRGDADRAVQLAAESLRQEQHLEKRWLAGRSLQVLGAVAAERGENERAARLFGAAEGMHEVIGASSLTPERQAVNEVPARLRSVMSAEAFAAVWESGRRMPFRAAIAFALEGEPNAPPETRASETADAATEGALPADSRSALQGEPVGEHDLAGASALDVRTLGRVEIRRNGVLLDDAAWSYARPRELLLYLLAHPDGRTREQIGLDFWPEISAAQVKNNFHVTLHHLRKTLGGNGWVRYQRGRYRVAGRVRYDAAEFEDGARKALQELRARPESAPAAASLASVLAAYGGDYLEEEGAGEWHLVVRDRLSRLLGDGLMELGQYYSVEGRQGEASECFRRLLEHDPVHEEAARYLMLTLSRDDRRTEALRVYERLQKELQSELGVTPAQRVRDVAEAVRAGARV